MGARTPTPQTLNAPHFQPGPGSDPGPRGPPASPSGKVLGLGHGLIRTIRHFWPQWNRWLGELPDTRFPELVIYHRCFLLWWGRLLFLCKLGSRRQLDFQCRDLELQILANLDLLSACHQESLPVNKTLSHFLGHVGSGAIAQLRTQCVRRLIRNKVLEGTRLLGRLVFAVDGTGFLSFKRRTARTA